MVAEAKTSDLNQGQNSTFAGGRVAALQTAGAAEATRLAEDARQSAIGNITAQRASYLGAPVGTGASGIAPNEGQPSASSWMDQLPAYAQLAYGGVNGIRSLNGATGGGLGDFVGGIGRGIAGGIGSIFGRSGPQAPPSGVYSPANPGAFGYFTDRYPGQSGGYGPSMSEPF